MDIVRRVRAMKEACAAARSQGKVIGFVPTMGALHSGHRALLARARADNDVVVMSVFVNPTQFNDPADLTAYPRTLEAGIAIAGPLVDHVIAPPAAEVYADDYRYRVSEWTFSRTLEGVHRPGHFDGMLTVVMRLLNLVQPHRAYFGEKDWQQLRLVEGMVKAFFLPVEIVACATERDPDGLALSSRNRRLSRDARTQAAIFPRILRTAPTAEAARAELQARGFAVDYVEDREGVRLGAIRVENVRLIDNVRL
jgi:pantoate--beta-alanine ligase